MAVNYTTAVKTDRMAAVSAQADAGAGPAKLEIGTAGMAAILAVFTLNEEAEVLDKWFGRTVILSDRRFTYEEAQQIIETGKGDFAEEVLTLNRLAQRMRKTRFKRGAVSFQLLLPSTFSSEAS